jgi:hypothetical protein
MLRAMNEDADIAALSFEDALRALAAPLATFDATLARAARRHLGSDT